MISRRALLAGSGAAALAGCGDGAKDKTLNVAVLTLPVGYGNPFTSNNTPSTAVWFALFDGLTRFDDQFALRPALAESWVQRDPLTWAFTLRRNVTFSNGKPFDAAAVVATVEWLRTPEGQTTLVATDFGPGFAARAEDPHTVVLTTGTADTILPARVSWLPIVEPEAWRTLGPERFARAPVGTGPWGVTAWGDARIEAVRNAGSWRPPKIDRIAFVPIPDPIARAQALLSGAADVGMVDRESLGQVNDRGVSIVSSSGQQVLCIGFITEGRDNSPFRHRAVRQAANYAVDKERIVSEILLGQGAPAGQLAPSVAAGYNPAVKPYPYDPDEARALLREAGYADGFTFVLTIINDSATTSIYQAVARDLAAVGIRAEIRIVPFAAWAKGFFGGEWGEAEATGVSAITRMNDAWHGLSVFGGERRPAFHRDPELIATAQEIAAISDPAARIARLQQAAVQVHEAAPAIFLVDFALQMGFGPRVATGKVATRVPVYEDIDWKTA